jgi:hypothetical protein
MRRRSPVLILASLSLLGMQLSGLHMHVDAHGYSGAPQGTHVHGERFFKDHHATHSAPKHDEQSAAGHEHTGSSLDHRDGIAPLQHGDPHEHAGNPGDHEHDYGGDTDISIVVLGTGIAKLPLFLVGFAFGPTVAAADPAEKIRFDLVDPRPPDHHERWRPPLRAPPLTA